MLMHFLIKVQQTLLKQAKSKCTHCYALVYFAYCYDYGVTILCKLADICVNQTAKQSYLEMCSISRCTPPVGVEGSSILSREHTPYVAACNQTGSDPRHAEGHHHRDRHAGFTTAQYISLSITRCTL